MFVCVHMRLCFDMHCNKTVEDIMSIHFLEGDVVFSPE